jgi:hypothetical protein
MRLTNMKTHIKNIEKDDKVAQEYWYPITTITS